MVAATSDRIYIGGIDPLHGLTVSNVLQRLEARAATEGLVVSDLHQGRCHLQFNAVTSASATKTSLETIQSWFHNVTWKGCKLVVQKARPHLLQRLEEERQAMRQRGVEAPVETTAERQTSGDPSSEPPLKRHWKVKRGYCGEVVRLVDTQPCRVDDWAMLVRIRKRHQAQQDKDLEQKKSKPTNTKKEKAMIHQLDSAQRLRHAQKQSYYNRSIHLRFEDAVAASSIVKRDTPKPSVSLVDPSDDDEHDDDDDDDDDDSHDGPVQADATIVHAKPSTETYVWSDDDSEEDREMETHPTVPADLEHNTTIIPPGTTSYVFSDDESSDGETSKRNRLALNVNNELDEFAAAMDTSYGGTLKDDNESANELTFDDDDDEEKIADTIHETLQDDVDTNLKVFAQLFPEYSQQQSVKAAQEQGVTSKQKAEPKSSSSGWGAMGQMLRFDPTKAQAAAQFVLDPTEEDVEDSADDPNQDETVSKSNENPDELPGESESLVPDAIESETTPSDHAQSRKTVVYEQDKLELVFKEARDPMPVASTESGTFSFGFDLGAASPAPSATAGAFAFSFTGMEVSGNDVPTLQDVDVTAQVNDKPAHVGQPAARSDFCPHAFEFPSASELDKYVQNFYHQNDGARIIRDLDGWRNDPEVKQRWLKERLALTQDWKRKRKYALSKKQKRFR